MKRMERDVLRHDADSHTPVLNERRRFLDVCAARAVLLEVHKTVVLFLTLAHLPWMSIHHTARSCLVVVFWCSREGRLVVAAVWV